MSNNNVSNNNVSNDNVSNDNVSYDNAGPVLLIGRQRRPGVAVRSGGFTATSGRRCCRGRAGEGSGKDWGVGVGVRVAKSGLGR